MPASNVAAEKRSQPQILVETAGLSEEEWLAYRRKGIGGSDVAALLGISPWRTARDLYFDKLNIVAVEDNEDNWVALEMGHLLEPLVAKIFQHRTGYKIYQIKKMFQHPQYSWMLADVDYFVELPDGSTAILEIKTTNYNARDNWWLNGEETVPVYYEAQGRHYFSVATTAHLPTSFSFPLGKYYGVSLVIDRQALSDEIRRMMRTIPIDLDKIGTTLGLETQWYVSDTPPQLRHLFSELYTAIQTEPVGYFKIKAIELLYHMDQLTQISGCDSKYFDKKQIQATKAIRAYLISHLDEKVPLEQLAKEAHLNLSVFHLVFSHIYGDTPYAYLKKYKMNLAAQWLSENKMKIGDIALELGYSNASKFAKAFQSVYGMLPKDYRKNR